MLRKQNEFSSGICIATNDVVNYSQLYQKANECAARTIQLCAINQVKQNICLE